MAKIGDSLQERRYTHKLICPACKADVLLMTEKAAHGQETLDYSNTQWPDGTETKEFEVISCKSCNAEDIKLTQENVREIEHFKMEVKT